MRSLTFALLLSVLALMVSPAFAAGMGGGRGGEA